MVAVFHNHQGQILAQIEAENQLVPEHGGVLYDPTQILGIPIPRQPDITLLGSLRTPGQHRSIILCQVKSGATCTDPSGCE